MFYLMIENLSLTLKHWSILGSEFCVNDILLWTTNESEINDRKIPGFPAAAATGDPKSGGITNDLMCRVSIMHFHIIFCLV